MTWTKLGDEYSDEARDLTDAEYRTHTDALGWSNRRGLDLLIPKRDLRKFGESPNAGTAPDGLIAKGWWEDRGDCWYVGLRFPEWQLERAVVKQRQEANALRVRRSRMHKAGDHSICMVGNCPAAPHDVMHYETRDETHHETDYPGRDGSGPTDPPVPKSKALDQTQDQNHLADGGAGGNTSPSRPAPVPQSNSAANSQNRGVHNGSKAAVADQAPQISSNDADSTTAGSYARVRLEAVPFPEPAGSAGSGETTPAWLSLDCPWCGAEAGHLCVNRSTHKTAAPHDARIRAAAQVPARAS